MKKCIPKNSINLLLSSVVIAAALIISYSAYVNAQSPTSTGPGINISFPVQELGGCQNKDDCRNYCNDPAHIDTCISFAQNHGLMNKKEADEARQFGRALSQGNGPGGCKSADECKNFCSNLKNVDACLDFAKSHGLKNEDTDQAEKIREYLASGGQMPGGCTSKESCEAYCGDFSHAEECYNFAKNAGLNQISRGPNKGEIPPGQFQKFLELVKKGETPGGCKSRDECESYCRGEGHLQECLDFGTKMGFISSDEAAKIKATGGRGPGGCDSEDSCSTYCRDSSHREECFQFGKEHGFISEDEENHIKEGMTRLRAGLGNAPAEVRACVQSVLGTSTIDNIESGNLIPGPDTAQEVRQCFEKFGEGEGLNQMFKNAPPGILNCLKEEGLGDTLGQITSGQMMPTPEMADAFRECNEEINKNEFRGQQPSTFQQLEQAPQAVRDCLKSRFGDKYRDIIEGGGPSAPISKEMMECFQSLKKEAPGNSENEREQNLEGLPPEFMKRSAPPFSSSSIFNPSSSSFNFPPSSTFNPPAFFPSSTPFQPPPPPPPPPTYY